MNDADTGLTYMQQRYYDPVAGRFLSIDPVTTDANTGSSFNRYSYANNSPYKYIDPDGRDPITENDANFLKGSLLLGWAQAAMDHSPAGGAGVALAGMLRAEAKQTASTAGASAVKAIANDAKATPSAATTIVGPATDTATGSTIGRIIVDSKANAMIEPVGGATVAAGKGGVDTHTLYPNGSNYQRLNPQGHPNNPTPYGHGHQEGTGPGKKGQGSSITLQGTPVRSNTPEAHWPIN